MIERIMLGTIILLIAGLIVFLTRQPSAEGTLEKSVRIKKLRLTEKVLDSQLNKQPDIAGLLQATMRAAPRESEDDDEEEKTPKTPVGYVNRS
jgi:hypothetical protein